MEPLPGGRREGGETEKSPQIRSKLIRRQTLRADSDWPGTKSVRGRVEPLSLFPSHTQVSPIRLGLTFFFFSPLRYTPQPAGPGELWGWL